MPTINAAGLALIEHFEGCELTAYQDSGGIWSVGYGHTGPDVCEGMTISQPRAVALLGLDVTIAERDVAALVEVELTPNEFSALVSFQFNTGSLSSSAGLALINRREFLPAWDDHFCLWIHDAKGSVDVGLIRRRAAERALFLTPG